MAFTHATWRHNFRGGAAVTVTHRGEVYTTTGTLVPVSAEAWASPSGSHWTREDRLSGWASGPRCKVMTRRQRARRSRSRARHLRDLLRLPPRHHRLTGCDSTTGAPGRPVGGPAQRVDERVRRARALRHAEPTSAAAADAPVHLLVPPMTGSASMWLDLVPHLSQLGPVMSVDLPGRLRAHRFAISARATRGPRRWLRVGLRAAAPPRGPGGAARLVDRWAGGGAGRGDDAREIRAVVLVAPTLPWHLTSSAEGPRVADVGTPRRRSRPARGTPPAATCGSAHPGRQASRDHRLGHHLR